MTFKGTKYRCHDYVIIGWQDDDLPKFGRIRDLIVVQDTIFFELTCVVTLGIDRHFHSFNTNKGEMVLQVSELVDHQVFNTHFLTIGLLYITFHSHIEKK